MRRVMTVQNAREGEHPILIQCLAEAVMHWPLVSAVAGIALAVGLTGALGWAAFDGLARLVG